MPEPWYMDARMLDAGDARRIRINADIERASKIVRAVNDIPAVRRSDLNGDLDAAAERLGVNVADLVRMRRRIGTAATHRAPSLLARLAARFTRKG